eukprot:gnl/MRDRNA2_/MRDRNA2_33944_c0_seq1.p1 gnl/MRDRNA2_/MRDRNA2_33944_c0~~gnl/MRDRNA2_/MRDRNA2_33944_c0_seq1.p1  ORF type:complete len:980 (+),score=182.45 gnl/MRDRNA2_/MRDRNA2_33944_c0_seq1:382-3321(+)
MPISEELNVCRNGAQSPSDAEVLMVGSGCEGVQLVVDDQPIVQSSWEFISGVPLEKQGLVGPGFYQISEWPGLKTGRTFRVKAWTRPVLKFTVSSSDDFEKVAIPIPDPSYEKSVVIVAVAKQAEEQEGAEAWLGWNVLDTKSVFGRPKVLRSRRLGKFVERQRRDAAEALRFEKVAADLRAPPESSQTEEEVKDSQYDRIMVEFKVLETPTHVQSKLRPRVLLPKTEDGVCGLGLTSTIRIEDDVGELDGVDVPGQANSSLMEGRALGYLGFHPQFSKMEKSKFYIADSKYLPQFEALPDSEKVSFDPRFSERPLEVNGESITFQNKQVVKWKHCFAVPAGDQGSCGSCWAWAGMGAQADRQCIQDPKSMLLPSGEVLHRFSVQHVLSCSELDGCNGGTHSQILNHLANRGAALDVDYGPYESKCWEEVDGVTNDQHGSHCVLYLNTPEDEKPCDCREKRMTTQTRCRGSDVDSTYRAGSLQDVGGYNSVVQTLARHREKPASYKYGISLDGDASNIVDQMKAELYFGGPLFAAFQVYENFFSFFRRDPLGVYTEATGAQRGGHAVVMTGWSSEEDRPSHWILRNSWGPDWAEQGYFRFLLGENLCEIESMTSISYMEDHLDLPQWSIPVEEDTEVIPDEETEEERRRRLEEEEEERKRKVEEEIRNRRRMDAERLVKGRPELEVTKAVVNLDFGDDKNDEDDTVTVNVECNRPCEPSPYEGWGLPEHALEVFAEPQRIDDTSFEVKLRLALAWSDRAEGPLKFSVKAQTATRKAFPEENKKILVGEPPQVVPYEASISVDAMRRPVHVIAWLELPDPRTTSEESRLIPPIGQQTDPDCSSFSHAYPCSGGCCCKPGFVWEAIATSGQCVAAPLFLNVKCDRECKISWQESSWLWAAGSKKMQLDAQPDSVAHDNYVALQLSGQWYWKPGLIEARFLVEAFGREHVKVIRYETNWLKPRPTDAKGITVEDVIMPLGFV